MAKVAFLGLGVMGYPMAGHLRTKGGHDVTVYNRTAAKAERWVAQHGGKSAPTPKQAAEGQDFVMSCVGNDHDLREVTLGPNGAFLWAEDLSALGPLRAILTADPTGHAILAAANGGNSPDFIAKLAP